MKKEDLEELIYNIKEKSPILNICCMCCNNCEVWKDAIGINYRCKLHNIKLNDAMDNVCFNYCPLNMEYK